jgi:hypothetical protein
MSANLEEDIVEAIYRGTCDSDGLIQAVRSSGIISTARAWRFREFDMVTPEAPLLIGTRTFDESYFTHYGDHAQFDPAPVAFAAMPIGRVSTIERLVPTDFLRDNPFLNDSCVRFRSTPRSAGRCSRIGPAWRWCPCLAQRTVHASDETMLRAWSV